MIAANFREVAVRSTVLFFACYALQHGSTYFANLVRSPVHFTATNAQATAWEASLSSLPSGRYYVSLGRPRSPCSIAYGTATIATTRGALPELRTSLLLGGGFDLDRGHGTTFPLVISCDHKDTTVGVFTHEPIVTTFHTGLVLQSWRGFTEALLGPIIAMGMLLASLVGILQHSNRLSNSGNAARLLTDTFNDYRFVFFGLVTLFYACSLSYWLRLHLNWITGTCVHVVARNLFAVGAVVFFSRSWRHPLALAQVCVLIVALSWAILSPTTLMHFYRWEYLWFPLSSLLLSIGTLSTEPRSKSDAILRSLLLSWTAIQVLDATQIWLSFGAYSAPAMIAILGCTAIYMRSLESDRAVKIESAASSILKVIDSQAPIDSVLKEVARIARNKTSFLRSSAYIDGFCVGAQDRPGEAFYRIDEMGYRKDTSRDAVITFSEGRGIHMAQALSTNNTVLHKGVDGAWFLVIPIGRHACINLSDDRPRSAFLAYESQEIVNRILPSLRSLDRSLIEIGIKQGAALQKLRSLRGDGVWDETIGAIFVDVNEYSKHAEFFGDPFPAFINATFLPAMIKCVSGLAQPEHVAGDEVYFTIITGLFPSELTVLQACAVVLEKLDTFLQTDGQLLCLNHGFPAVSCSIGVNVAPATILSDAVRVRTSGTEINHAKRLQEEAGQGNILIKTGVELPLDGSRYAFGEPFLIHKKKNTISARRLVRL